MALQKILFKPGVNKENTRYTNESGWYISDKIRFRQGTPEKIGGWSRISAFSFLGICRSLWNWITLSFDNLLALGTNLKGVDDIASSLINFEQSISAELEAELFTGRELNLERARYYALTNKTGELAKEIEKSGGKQLFQNAKTRIEQEAIAKAYGMTRDTMADMIAESEALKNMSAKDKVDLEDKIKKELEAIETLKKQGKIEEANNRERELTKKLGNDTLKDQIQARAIAEKQVEATQKLAEAMDVFAKVLRPISKLFDLIIDNARELGRVLLTIGGVAMIARFGGLRAAFVGISKIIGNLLRSLKLIGPAAVTAGATAGRVGANVAAGAAAGRAGANVAAGATAGRVGANVAAGAAAGGMKLSGAAAQSAAKAGTAIATRAVTASGTKISGAAAQSAVKAGTATATRATMQTGAKAVAQTGAQAAASGSGGWFSNITKGLFKLNPIKALQAAVKNAGGIGKFLLKGLKASALGSILAGFFAYEDMKNILANPFDEEGNKLSDKDINKKLGRIAAGTLGTVLGGLIAGALTGGNIIGIIS